MKRPQLLVLGLEMMKDNPIMTKLVNSLTFPSSDLKEASSYLAGYLRLRLFLKNAEFPKPHASDL